MNSSRGERTARFVVYALVLVFVALVFSQAGKKFVLDELDFPVVAKATSEIWRPIYYRGEGAPLHVGLYHPPLYIYALAAYIKVFGFSENTVRSFGVLCTLLTTLITITIASRWLTRDKLRFFAPLFCGLYLLNPYTIANTTLPDIDQTILPVLLSFFVLLLFDGKTRRSALAGVFGLLLWTKLTTPLVLVPFAFLYWTIQTRSLRRAFVDALIVFGTGALLFVSTYWLYCKATELPFQYTFEFLLHSFTKGGDSHGAGALLAKIGENFGNSAALVLWMTAPLVLLFFAGSVALSLRGTVERGRTEVLFLAGLAAFVTAFYCGLISPFGGFFKYPFPIFQFACLTFAFAMTAKLDAASASHRSTGLWIAGIALVVALLQVLLLRDRMDLGTTWSARHLALTAVAGGVLLGLALGYRAKGMRIALAVTCVVTGVAIGTSLGISRVQAIAPFPTKYEYGQRGMDETVSWLKEQLAPGEVVWSMKDVGFYSGNHYTESYDDFFTAGGKAHVLELSKSKVRYFVATKGIGEDRIDVYSDIREALDECCLLVKNFGNYYIYKAKR